ncbi:MAG TPA: SprT family zinc-dependent metalloprotease [Spirochaetota bacterium]|nr:SprT family zinc-dependent metalloprotease [Spirochaetota bacterium]
MRLRSVNGKMSARQPDYGWPDFQLLTDRNRKKISLSVTPDNKIIVKAPVHVNRSTVSCFVKSNKDWIEKQLQKNKNRFPDFKPITGRDGDLLLYMGNEFELCLEPWQRKKPCLVKDKLFIYARGKPREKILNKLITWYKENARAIIMQRIAYFRKQISININKVTIKTLKSRWGSCSLAGNLNFNWKIIMAPIHIIDYVIVHELCHFHHPDHSAAFWKEVACYMPDYKNRRKWLKEYGVMLDIRK